MQYHDNLLYVEKSAGQMYTTTESDANCVNLFRLEPNTNPDGHSRLSSKTNKILSF